MNEQEFYRNILSVNYANLAVNIENLNTNKEILKRNQQTNSQIVYLLQLILNELKGN